MARALEPEAASAVPTPWRARARLSRGLAQLLNAAVMDETFGGMFLADPLRAAVLAAGDPGTAFGCSLPDPALRVPPILTDESDRRLLSAVPRCGTLSEMARHLALISTVPGGGRSTARGSGLSVCRKRSARCYRIASA